MVDTEFIQGVDSGMTDRTVGEIRFAVRCMCIKGRSLDHIKRQLGKDFGYYRDRLDIGLDEFFDFHEGVACDTHSRGGSRH